MKLILISIQSYSLTSLIVQGFENSGWEVKVIDPKNYTSLTDLRRQHLYMRLPVKYFGNALSRIQAKLNQKYIEIVEKEKPELVLVYNDMQMLPETAKKIKKISKLVFYFGDSPYFVHKRPYNLPTFLQADYIFAPDTFWIEQMRVIGIKNIDYLLWGYSKITNYITELKEEERNEFGNDIVYVGRNYHDTWGYKKALLFSKLTDLDLKIYGDSSWIKWFSSFPELEKKVVLRKRPLTFDEVNRVYNSSKITVVDGNPGILNGIHLRVFEAIGSGILPVVEYRKDIPLIFGSLEIPVIKDYSEAKEIVNFYLSNEKKRKELALDLRSYINITYTPELAAKQIINKCLHKE